MTAFGCFRTNANMQNVTVTIERLERALALAAYIVMLDGPIAAPLFDRLERELAAARATNGTVARAKALLESYRTNGALKAIA